MSSEDIHQVVVYTARAAAALFVLALLNAGAGRRAARLWLGFLAAQTVHFAAVLWFAAATGGRNLFPGGISLQDAGGWLAIMGIFAFFYLLALPGVLAGRTGRAGERWLRVADGTGRTLIGLMFLAAYVPLVTRSAFFALPAAAIVIALGVYLSRTVTRAAAEPP